MSLSRYDAFMTATIILAMLCCFSLDVDANLALA